MAVRSEKSAKKSRERTVLISQEIAFAKVLAGNDKKLRDRAVKKLKKWLTTRAQGKCEFTEDDFMRIWTGLFYCMWMSDKLLIQEELAESLSHLIHCFEKKSEAALLFIKCFYKVLAVEWTGLDQYRIDKFCLLSRRMLRQSFEFCKRTSWDIPILKNLMAVYLETIFSILTPLGFLFHFIDIYLEELAKVSNGELANKVVQIAIDPFVKLAATTKDGRIRNQIGLFFKYLMKQTDVGLEFEEKVQAWKEQGFPGRSPESMELVQLNDAESLANDYEENLHENPLDPRAGSVHVVLPQIPVDVNCIKKLLKRYQLAEDSTLKGKKMLNNLTKQFLLLKEGKFPEKIGKPRALDPDFKKKKIVKKSAQKLLTFTKKLDKKRTKRRTKVKHLNMVMNMEMDDDEVDECHSADQMNDSSDTKVAEAGRTIKRKKKKVANEICKVEDEKQRAARSQPSKVPDLKLKNESFHVEPVTEEPATLQATNGRKRKLSGDWQIDELDVHSPEYNKLILPKVIKIEKKVDVSLEVQDCLVNKITIPKSPDSKTGPDEWNTPLKNGEVEIFIPNKRYQQLHPDKAQEVETTGKPGQLPAFFEKARAKAIGKRKSCSAINTSFEKKSPSSRRISFALNRNMAQDNEEYLQEVKNSPKIPFDGSKKPSQSALKAGLSPSPINPFYRLKKK